MKHPIPSAALDDRLGFLGTSGSGKTYNAGTATEILLSRRARIVVIDPLGVWWGLRLLADGKKPSRWDVAIFGGPHGDLPLTENAGALIGETAATMAESCIIDLSELKTKSAERRFMVAFLETIYRKASGEPFHLIVDEADLFAPQKPSAGDEVLLGHMENIVRRGRIKGFIPWLISQRPAVLNKNVLSQVDGLLAFKLTSVQDRDALDAWIEGQADKVQGKAIKDALPTLQIGEGVVWIPGRGVLDAQAKFPAKVTFDSSRTPKRGEKLKRRKLKPLNLGKLKEQLATVEAETKASDPRALRAEIAALKAERDKLVKAKTPAVKADPDAIRKAEERGFAQAERKLRASMRAYCNAEVLEVLTTLQRGLEQPLQRLAEQIKHSKTQKPELTITYEQETAAATPAVPRAAPTAPLRLPPRATPTAPIGDGALTNPQLKLLQSLAWWKAMGHTQPARPQIAAIAGWAPSGSNLKDRLSEILKLGLVTYPRQGLVELTPEGEAAAPAPDTGATLIESIRSILTGPQLKLFEKLREIGAEIDRPALAEAVGWEPGGSNLKDRLSELVRLELVTYPQRGTVALQDWVRDDVKAAA